MAPTLANSWKTYFGELPMNGDADRELHSLKKLLHGSIANATAAMKDESDTVLLGVCPITGNITLLHHFQVHGGTRLNRDVLYSALIGMGARATPVLVDPDSLFLTIEFDSPTWTTLKAIDVKENVKSTSAPTSNAARASVKTVVPLAPFMVSAILDEDDTSAEAIFVALLSAINDYDQVHDGDDQYPKASDECRGVLQYLWAVAQDSIPSVTQGAVIQPAVIAFYDDLHKKTIASPDTVLAPGGGATPSDQVMRNVAAGLTEMTTALQTQRTDKQARDDEKKNSFTKLPDHVQQMYLFAA